MLVAAAVCPHPPLLVPQAAAGAAAELDGLRAACDRAVAALLEAEPELVVVVGGGPASREHPVDAPAGLEPYGPPVRLRAGEGPPGRGDLPLPLALGRWLVERRPGSPPPLLLHSVAADAPTDECAALGERLAARADRVALLAIGDASARRTDRSPGYVDAAAIPHDDAVAAALADADVDALLALEPAESARLLAAGRAAWQVLAGAAGRIAWHAELLAHEAPYGVGYLVAAWRRA
ncbi:MAG: hypothetical protein ACTHOD_20045 [Motilibacteraceae bacterium]